MNDAGTDEENIFVDNRKTSSNGISPIDDGMVLDKLLIDKSNETKLVKADVDAGNADDSVLDDILSADKRANADIHEPKELDNLFDAKFREDSFVSELRVAGNEPSKLLVDKFNETKLVKADNP